MLQPRFLHFSSSTSNSYHQFTKPVSSDGCWAPMFNNFVCFCQDYTFVSKSVSICIFFQKNSCFSSLFVGIENNFAPANGSDIGESMLSHTLHRSSLNSFRHSSFAFIEIELARKYQNFNFRFEKTFPEEKRTLTKLFLQLDYWKIENIFGTTNLIQRNCQPAQKDRQFP